MVIYISAVDSDFPAPTPVLDQVAAGQISQTFALRTGLTSVAISVSSGPQMALRAAERALCKARSDPKECILHLHSSMSYSGYDLWSPSSYIEAKLGIRNALGLTVDQLSNGGLAAFDVAFNYLMQKKDGFALITTGERYSPPLFDRWRSDPGTVFADGGTALVLSSSGGFAEVLSIVNSSDPDLESIARSNDAPAEAPGTHRLPASVGPGREALVNAIGLEALLTRLQSFQQRNFRSALEMANLRPSEVNWHIVPNLGLPRLRHQIIEPLGLSLDRTTWSWGRTVGHLGGGDQIAGLNYLRSSSMLQVDDICVLHGMSGGFTWTTVVLRVLSTDIREAI